MKKNKTIIKKVGVVVACAGMAVGVAGGVANANCNVYGYLTTSVHVVPILKDKANATTAVSAGNYSKIDKVKSKTTVYAYDADGNYVTESASATGGDAMEGRSSGQATASIRAMAQAKGVHKGKNATVSGYVTANTSWKK